MKRWAVAVGLLGALAAGSRGAHAAPAVVVALDYSAPDSCPRASSFREQVLARTSRVSFAEPSSNAALVWKVEIAETSGGSRGKLRVVAQQPSPLEREVHAARCEQVVDALALVAALSVDPDASLTAREKPTPAAPPPVKPAATAPALRTKPPATRPSSEPGSSTRLSLGLMLTARTGLAPELAWAPRPSVGLSFRSRTGYTWGLAVSATLARGHAAVDVGQADFTWSLARLEAFPLRVRYRSWRFDPLVFVEAGQLRARGVAVLPVAEARRPAVFVGALGRLSYLAFDLLWFGLEGGGSAALVRDRFYLFETTTVFRVPAVGGYLGAGVGLEFL
ncbi:MAG: hypothetical protein ABUL60_32240 [Myxococcales bacterium]